MSNELLVQLMAMAGGLVGVYIGLQKSIAKLQTQVALLKQRDKHIMQLMVSQLRKTGVDIELPLDYDYEPDTRL